MQRVECEIPMDVPAHSYPLWAEAAILALALALPAPIAWLRFCHFNEPGSPLVGTVTALSASQYGLPLVWVLLVRRESFSPGHSWKGGGEGIASGLFALELIWLLYQAWLKPSGFFDGSGGAIFYDRFIQLGMLDRWGYIGFGVFYSLAHSFLEEYYWRLFTYGRLRRLLPIPAAILLSSLGFASVHLVVLACHFGWRSPATLLGCLAVAIAGAYWAWLFERTESLLGPWLSHVIADAALFLVGFEIARSFPRAV